jgi:predicted RecA/RadA family phage recombinase
MLAADVAGQPYNKAEPNRDLQARIDRNRSSIEFKHQNISAALQGLGEAWISGYKPAVNLQMTLVDAVARWLSLNPAWLGRTPSAMKNYVQPGNTITLTAPYAVTSGDCLLVGAIFGVAAGIAILGDPVETAVESVHDLKKVASQAWAAGDKIYWDNTAEQTTKTPTANTLIGVATEAVAGGATDLIGRVRLNGAF